MNTASTSVTLVSPDISCEHCQRAIESALGALPGVAQVSVDIANKSIQLFYDPAQVSLEQIEKQLDEIGYSIVH
ncbi:heavy-metal-associated domain-containing protein [Thermogemmatispora sp.]|uniref:heavy-metal-associated domain-containing protein n=1 Tax=Thermogemmatispora sp. TaxID=1968838 RepID=UPI001DB350A2|nr:heavy-metal-associated domain-containing protein [Thermogemmatispora sp.]MBX5450164.1 heavy-metal-associated domain-containing protein [Thermogemmatispora sp.]